MAKIQNNKVIQIPSGALWGLSSAHFNKKKKFVFSKLVLLREMQKIVCLMEYFDLALLSYL